MTVLKETTIPVGWSIVALGDVADIRLGRTPPRNESRYWDNGKHPWVAISDLNNGRVATTRELVSDAAMSEVLSGKVADAGTLLMSFKLTIGKVGILTVPAAHNEAIAAIVPRTDEADRDFLFFALQTLDYWKYKDAYVKGATLSKKKLTSLPVLMPSLPEQRAIAHILRTVQQAIEATEQVIAAARELKRSLMRHVFIARDWELRSLGEIAQIERGKFSHRPRNDPAFYGGDFPFVQTGDVAGAGGRLTTYTQTLNAAGLAVSRVFPAGTIVITIAANIGHVAILEFDSAFPDSLIGITPTDQVSNAFLNYYLMTQQPEMDRLAPRGTQKNINIEFLKPWPVPVPPRHEQDEIVSVLNAVDHKITTEEARREALQALVASLLSELMSGRTRVPESMWGSAA